MFYTKTVFEVYVKTCKIHENFLMFHYKHHYRKYFDTFYCRGKTYKIISNDINTVIFVFKSWILNRTIMKTWHHILVVYFLCFTSHLNKILYIGTLTGFRVRRKRELLTWTKGTEIMTVRALVKKFDLSLSKDFTLGLTLWG